MQTEISKITSIPAVTEGVGLAVSIAEFAMQHNELILLIVPDFSTAFRLERELSFFKIPIVHFPDWETLPYDSFSPHQDLISQRIQALYNLPNFKKGILIVPVATLMHKLCPQSYIDKTTFIVKVGDVLDLNNIKQQLENSGYHYNSQVMEHGEYTIRGAILDIFPMGSKYPYRIELFDNEIETIRKFDPETQRSIETISEIKLLPAREYPFSEEAITEFRTKWRDYFSGDPRNCIVYQDVTQGIKSQGLEYFLPLFFDATASFLDYLPEKYVTIQIGDIHAAAHEFWDQVKERYEQYRHDVTRPLLAPMDVFISPDRLLADIKETHPLKIAFDKPQKLPNIDDIFEFASTNRGKILFCAESSGRKLILEELLQKKGIKAKIIHKWQELVEGKSDNYIVVAPFEVGGVLEGRDIVVLTENELLGRKVLNKRHKRGKTIDPDAAIRNLAELNIDSPVVHLEFGVGRYKGLTTLTVSGLSNEFLTLEYANNDKLYVPVTSMHLISRYSGTDLEHAPLHQLGTDRWTKEKRKASEKIRDVAAELLNIYAKRGSKKGFSLPAPDDMYYKFASGFAFEETIDQQHAIEQVIKDLTSETPMDRVVCGDVGFGKTEVAMRAAFLVAQSGKQVVMLVPTTLLAHQHYQTFVDRFADFPINVEVISRFKTKKEQTEILDKVANGNCDIIIGTHKLLQNDIKFKDHGMIIIDEEHRFGVRQKERLKEIRAQVHVLTLTATPIPRTLNMSMTGIRDLSIISTPPAKRLAVRTFVRQKNKSLVQEAINRELSRGGQVYYLHNEVDTIENLASELTDWVPNARIAVAHGQMPERELEHVMSDFYHQKYNVLVCTTIIETGIDVPTANTIIMDRSDKLGLAQLHQLRGRVGRSHHQAYAFCLTPPENVMTNDSKKRLQALESLDTLGAGFMLATHDLEIRGTGELLGEEQSGNLHTIGFSLFMELLDNAIKSLQSGKEPSFDFSQSNSTEIDLQLPAIIPDDYLGDVHGRLVLYKRIATAKSKDELDELKAEMLDRFGVLPNQVKNLFAITELKIIATPLGIKSIKAGPHGGKIEFNPSPNINPQIIINLVQSSSHTFSFAGSTCIKFMVDLSSYEKRIAFILDVLLKLASN